MKKYDILSKLMMKLFTKTENTAIDQRGSNKFPVSKKMSWDLISVSRLLGTLKLKHLADV